MRNISRKRFIRSNVTAGAVIVGLRFPAGAAEVTFKLAHELPADKPMPVQLAAAAAKIAQESGGRVEIRLFPNGVLGTGAQIISQVRLGAVDFTTVGDSYLGNLARVAGISAVPFAFSSLKDAVATLDGPLRKFQRDAIAQLGLFTFNKSWPTGIRQTINGIRPINVMDDFKGLKLRTADDPVAVGLFKALGASPVPTAPSEIYSSLQTHVVDGVELPLSAMESYKVYEVQKYISYTNHAFTGLGLYMNLEAWQKLPANLQSIIDKNFDIAADLYRQDTIRQDASFETTLKRQGIAFNRPEIALASYRTAVRSSGLYRQLRELYGADAWNLLEKSVGKLA